MFREIKISGDKSPTLFNPEFGESYHSLNGAVSESQLVFIENGLRFWNNNNSYKTSNKIRIFEMGFGTGLNFLLTILQTDRPIYYEAIEKYPLNPEEWRSLDYSDSIAMLSDKFIKKQSPKEISHIYNHLHSCPWNEPYELTFPSISGRSGIVLNKIFSDLTTHKLKDNSFDIIYFDAFSPESQPELWSEEVFQNMYNALSPEGVLVTYSSKGIVKQALRTTGFTIERLPGPAGKRHVLRAIK